MDFKEMLSGVEGLDDEKTEAILGAITTEIEKASKERDNAIHARNRDKDALKELKEQVEELRQAKEDLENKDMSEVEKTAKQMEKLQAQLDTLSRERDEAQGTIAKMQKDGIISKLHSEISWNRELVPAADSLALVSRELEGVDLSDEKAAKAALDAALKERPSYIMADKKGGVGSKKNQTMNIPEGGTMTAEQATQLRGKNLVDNLDSAWAAVSQNGAE